MKYEYAVIGLECLSGKRVNCKDCMFRNLPRCKEKAAGYALEFIGRQQSKLNKLAEDFGFLKDEIRITRDYIYDNNLEWDLLSYCVKNKREEFNV